MSWTDSTSVKKHLIDLDQVVTDFRDVKVQFDGNGDAQLPHRGIVTASESVKRLTAVEPTGESGVTLTDELWADLTYDNLVPNQMVAAEDDGIQTVYQEGVDFIADWADGKIRRTSGGSISNGASVQVYYQRYELLTKSVDYTIDYATGELTVKVAGSLEPDSTVWVDYRLSAASGVDDLIAQAISQAEDKILTRLKDDYDGSSSDQGLITGATELTLSILCRALASRSVSDGGTSAEGRARAWRELAAAYQNDAWHTLRPLMKIPVMNSGVKKTNQSWEWF